MSFILFLEIWLILLSGCLCDSSQSKINDVCLKSNEEKLSINYTFLSAIPKEGLSSGIHTKFNKTDEVGCYNKCCTNTKCNIAWHLDSTCIIFECDWNNFSKCMPIKTKGDKLKGAKMFVLRSPVTQVDASGSTVVKTTQKVTTAPVLTTQSKSVIKIITVEISKNQTLVMPENNVTLSANVPGDTGSIYEYQWTPLLKPSDKNSGKLDTTKTKELKLTDLIVGDYQFQVEVRGNNSYGKATVFVFVKPAMKQNEPPVARIETHKLTVQLPNNMILDGTKSTDDEKIVSYNWELVKGPLEADKTMKHDQSMLNLDNLSAGSYIFKLTVKDATGASSSDTAYVTVLAEKDYPPVAEPGNNQIVNLPVKYVILNGSSSHDDKKIMFYEWSKKSDALTADIQGVREPILNLTNLQEGTYTFNLKVTDSAAQSNDKDVQIFVQPRTNSAPKAKAGLSDDKSMTVRLPASEAVLNGSLSSDDDKITQYLWQQIEGKPKLNLADSDKPIAYVYDLKIGVFKFNLTVFDKEKLASSDVVTLRINESKNQKPQARILKVPEYYHMETNVFKIDGSNSWDDVKIVQYKWSREDDSLAVGQVLENSDSSSVLMLTDLLPGIYKFKLQVYDVEGLFDSIITSVKIEPFKHEKNLVELQFICPLNFFTESKKNAFLNNIQLIVQNKLNSDTSRVVIHLVQLDKAHFDNSVTIVFYVTLNKGTQSTTTKIIQTQNESNTSLPKVVGDHLNTLETSLGPVVVEKVYIGALEVVEALSLMRYNSISIEYQIVRVETYVCQNNCSNHGQCDQVTKMCECDTFWTSSYIRERFGDGRPNCDWSIIYLIIFFGMLVLIIIITCWFFIWIKQRRCKSKKSSKIRKHKYMKLNEYDYENRSNSNSKVPKSLSNGIKSRNISEKVIDSLLNSESSLSSEEETVFGNKNIHRGDNSPIKKSSSFSSIPAINGNPLKTL